MGARETYPELVRMIRRLYEELVAHDRDYHHRTDAHLVMNVREFLVAVGELPAPEPVAAEVEAAAEAGEEDETEAGAEGAAQ
ncbi:MAG: hypothetical protein P1P84_13455 [Deferrisomatales bacterium]|nr:hypothetical protein [Deferrisomatales bacterium]